MKLERLGAADFDGEQLRRPGTWAVAFSADWCPFCRAFEPEFEKLRGSGSFEVAIADMTDMETPLWERFQVDVVPTVVVFRDGKPSFRRDGKLGRGLADSDLTAVRQELARGSPPSGRAPI